MNTPLSPHLHIDVTRQVNQARVHEHGAEEAPPLVLVDDVTALLGSAEGTRSVTDNGYITELEKGSISLLTTYIRWRRGSKMGLRNKVTS